jgi:peptidoglycan/xylan/chitin deacetylase (PgdA/CDA1 family)
VKPASRLLLAGSGTAATAALITHVAPAATSWRALRCWATPALAGLGRPDHVALTFDDGPDPASTPAFLDELDRLGWQATFFLLGSMVRQAPGLAAEVVQRGHEVAVHGDQHRSHLRRTPWATERDMATARDLIAEAAGVEPRWFRPPYGTLSTSSLQAARRLGLQTILWTAWGRDWRPKATPVTVTDDVARGLRPGATVLLHDSDCTSAPQSWRSALGALERLAEVFDDRGLRPGPLAEHGLPAAAVAA